MMNITDEYSLYENISNYTDLSEPEYLREKLGPKYLPLTLVLPITLAYVIIFVTGVIGNGATCIVIGRNPSMQTATNYYLVNLAVSDLLFLVLGLPYELSVYWQQYPWKWGLGICKLRAYVSEMSSYASVLTIVAFSLERYLAIYHPLRRYASGLKRPIRFICASWMIAIVFAAPFAVYTTVDYIEYPPRSKRYSKDSAICGMQRNNIPKFPLYELSCVLFFFLPMVFIAVLYVRMGLRIQSNTLEHSVEGSVHGETTQAQSRKTIIRMLSAVVITFFICWTPFHAQRLLYVYDLSKFDDVNEWLYPLGGCLYYFSTTANPILYNVMSAKYRDAFKETLCCSPSSSSIVRVDLSSVRDSSTVCGAGSRRESQVFRVRSVNYQRSIKCRASGSADNVSRVLARSLSDEADKEKRRVPGTRNDSSTNEKGVEGSSREPRKSSFVVHAKNGRVRYQTSDKDDSPSNETHI